MLQALHKYFARGCLLFFTSKMGLQIFKLLVWSCKQKYHPPEIGFCVVFNNQCLVPGFDRKRCCQGIPSRDRVAQPEFTEEILSYLKQWMRALASSALSTAPGLSTFGRSNSWKQWLGHKAVLGSNPVQWPRLRPVTALTAVLVS